MSFTAEGRRTQYIQHVPHSTCVVFGSHRFSEFTTEIPDLTVNGRDEDYVLAYEGGRKLTLVNGIGFRKAGTAADLIIVCCRFISL